MRDFWENCDMDFAHITTGKYQSYDDAVAMWHEEYLVDYDFSGKTIIDYGCGDGWLLNELPDNIKGCYGLDIAQRQIDAAIPRAIPGKAEFLLLPQDLTKFNAFDMRYGLFRKKDKQDGL